MKKIRITFCFTILVILVMTGCATIISTKNQHIPINSTPSGVSVSIFDSQSGNLVYNGTTPTTATLLRENRYRVEYFKEGFEKRTVFTERGINLWILGSIYFYIFPVFIDFGTGSEYTIKPKKLDTTLTTDNNSQIPYAVLTHPQKQTHISTPSQGSNRIGDAVDRLTGKIALRIPKIRLLRSFQVGL